MNWLSFGFTSVRGNRSGVDHVSAPWDKRQHRPVLCAHARAVDWKHQVQTYSEPDFKMNWWARPVVPSPEVERLDLKPLQDSRSQAPR